ncbi:hypothetical protein GF378_00985 [Candidatus Pacearchaeota archaeon]|nr:hypothetical protein [Candidatus Pacearchaeota archaeon]
MPKQKLQEMQNLKKTSKLFRNIFIHAFVREVIKNYSSELKYKIELREKEHLKSIENLNLKEVSPVVEKIVEKASEPVKERSEMPQIQTQPSFRPPKPLPKPYKIPPRLRIPEPQLPERLRYIQPEARPGVQIDLGMKLNPLISDPVVQTIECNGPNEKVIVRNPGQKATNITLNKDEIDNVIKKFSEVAKIPVHEGVFKVAVGKLVLSAIVSDVVGSKFIIKKLRYSPTPQGPGPGTSRLKSPQTFMKRPPRPRPRPAGPQPGRAMPGARPPAPNRPGQR